MHRSYAVAARSTAAVSSGSTKKGVQVNESKNKVVEVDNVASEDNDKNWEDLVWSDEEEEVILVMLRLLPLPLPPGLRTALVLRAKRLMPPPPLVLLAKMPMPLPPLTPPLITIPMTTSLQ